MFDFKSLSDHIKSIIDDHEPICKSKTVKSPAEDGVVCDPAHHGILYSDSNIRVLNVSVKPGEEETYHTHELYCMMYVDKPARIRYHELRKKPVIFDDPNPRLVAIPSEKLHKVTNLDTKPFCGFRIEIYFDIASHPHSDKIQEGIREYIDANLSSLNSYRQELLVPIQKTLLWQHAKPAVSSNEDLPTRPRKNTWQP